MRVSYTSPTGRVCTVNPMSRGAGATIRRKIRQNAARLARIEADAYAAEVPIALRRARVVAMRASGRNMCGIVRLRHAARMVALMPIIREGSR